MILPFANVLLLVTPLLDMLGGFAAFDLTDGVTPLLASFLAGLLLLLAPSFILLNTFHTLATFLVFSLFNRVMSTTAGRGE
jgi:hypothetical protein